MACLWLRFDCRGPSNWWSDSTRGVRVSQPRRRWTEGVAAEAAGEPAGACVRDDEVPSATLNIHT